MIAKNVIDVSKLPDNALDHRSPIWWGNLLLIFIETTMFGLLVAGYLYIRQNFSMWPPPKVEGPVLIHPIPDLFAANINLSIMILSCVPMFIADRLCFSRRRFAVGILLAICILMGVAAIFLRFKEFNAIHFRWNDNAYASIVWMILGMHLAHLITATTEVSLLTTWIFAKNLDDKHAKDVRVTAAYWYWMAGIWVPLYLLVFFGPRVL